MPPNTNPDFISVKIIGLEDTLFEGDVTAISSKNKKGDFDIIPDHTNFISVIQDQVIVVSKDGTQQKFEFNTGIVHFYGGIANIYLNINI